MHLHARTASIRWLQRLLFALILAFARPADAQNLIFVTGEGGCSLAQAIALANYANFVDPTAIGSATTSFGGCTTLPPPIPSYPTGPYSLIVTQTQITLTSIDNYWYGPNALPPIASSISIVPAAGTLTLTASHAGDPTPDTAHAFRFFYVSGGLEIQAGSLTLQNTVLQGGYVKGGDAWDGGGGAGMGGAIFNQGSLALANVSVIGNTAQGGTTSVFALVGNKGGGGMGQEGQISDGGGFGGSLGGAYGGAGSSGSATYGGGGGGGFVAGSGGGAVNPGGAPGGGKGVLGGSGESSNNHSGGAAGDGGGGGGAYGGGAGNGGGFGLGGAGGADYSYAGGGGGVGGGGGGSGYGGGGGFGGGGGGTAGSGGFGGGVGVGIPGGSPGFGAAAANPNPSGGAGMGGAIFNHGGSVGLLNVTATANAARGGSSGGSISSGLGAVLFNLNGNVTIDFSTFAGNFLSGNNGAGGNGGEDATVYSIAYGNKIQDGSASSASLKINNSIVHGTHGDGGAGNDILVNVVDGAHTNSSTVIYKGKNFVQFSTNVGSVSQTGSSPTQADPLLGALSVYRSSPGLAPVLPLGANSPAQYAAANCIEVDGSSPLTTDERGALRPYQGMCSLGAYQFDGDYIFAANLDVTL